MALPMTSREFSPEEENLLAQAEEIYNNAGDQGETRSRPNKEAYQTIMKMAGETSNKKLRSKIAVFAHRCASDIDEALAAMDMM